MKKLIKNIILVGSIFALTACGGSKAPGTSPVAPGASTAPAANVGKIGFSVSTLNNPYFATLVDGANAKAEELGLEIVVVDAGDATAKQASDIKNLISNKVTVLIINPVDSDAAASAVKDAKAAGVKVISVDRVINNVEVDSSIASDNVLGARLAGEYLTSLIGEGSQVAELEGVPGASATIERGDGFTEAAQDKLSVVAKQTANFNRAEGLSVMENILHAEPDIKGVFAHNDEMALGALEAIGTRDIKVIGFDATDDAVKSVKAGKLAATVAQKPGLMGATAVEVAGQLIKGAPVEKSIGVDVSLVTK